MIPIKNKLDLECVDEKRIYLFWNKENPTDISILCRKLDNFYWNALKATNQVWYKNNPGIKDAFTSLWNTPEYINGDYSEIQEFESIDKAIEFMYCLGKPKRNWFRSIIFKYLFNHK